ncbi:A disintegrin and metalloproteinase with thrombospondin motifs 9 isoform X3 [Tetranychus urticae]|uniref:A disintegrin and metalloproteinase with thrombospondin motifs 9 isoform X3 n=1 Tax=Tetranychus urticae TaxID=32264 RepID=UPI00077BB8B6|nr:A disintegrin and metalloproteinase with thrombospondin motifs 9 isoform X3 [Tetranychus urticae]
MNFKDWVRYIFLLSFVLSNILGQIESSNYDNLRQLSVKKSSLPTSSSLRSNSPSNVSSTLLRLKTSSFPLFLSPSSKPSATNHCQFGGKTYEPDDKWKPNLGSPFGLLPCVLCQCVTLQKKSRTVSRVRCRNIVSHCPKPNCSEPVLLPGRCCKICPDTESDEFEDDLAPLMNIDVESICESWLTVPKIMKKFLKSNKICSNNASNISTPTSTITRITPSTSTLPPTVKDNQIIIDEYTDTFQSNQESNIGNSNGTTYPSSKHRKCLYNNKMFDDGSVWKSSKDTCKMCSCQKGQIKCDTIVCPVPNCLNPITTSGDCCPSCLGQPIGVDIFQSSSSSEYRYSNLKWGRSKRSYSHERYLEVMVAADHSMQEYHGENLHHYILTLMATVSKVYSDDSIGNHLRISVVDVKMIHRREFTLTDHSLTSTLQQFCRWQRLRNTGPTYDCSILLTRHNLCQGHNSCDALGLARSSTVCNTNLSCAIIEDNGMSAAFTIAHEIGHILGLPHDDDSKCLEFSRNRQPERKVMARLLDNRSHPWSWSNCSRHFLTEFFDAGYGSCLLNKPPVNLLDRHFVHSVNGISDERISIVSPSNASITSSYLSSSSSSPSLSSSSLSLSSTSPSSSSSKSSLSSSALSSSSLFSARPSSSLPFLSSSQSWSRTQMPTIYGRHAQCELVFGPDASACPYEESCRVLWCDIPGHGCRTQHMPWADFTPCGRHVLQQCYQGSCVWINATERTPKDGGWGPWSSFSECSRSCGGGVQRATRECDNPRPSYGGKYCIGERITYRSCNNHLCPEGSGDFRASQCAEFNNLTLGIKELGRDVEWVPKYNVAEKDRCKLFCTAKQTGIFSMLKRKVIDGTPCSLETNDICVNGKCMPAGCDHILKSDKKLDFCGVCGGDNSTCQEVVGSLNHVQVHHGYNSLVIIPKGAANIEVVQHNSSLRDHHYLALKAADGSYLINGGKVVSLERRVIPYAGTVIEYSGSNQTMERINASKPINEPLFIEVLSGGDYSLPEIRYRYSSAKPNVTRLSNMVKPCTNCTKYAWRTSDWGLCSRPCGFGIQKRSVICLKKNKDANHFLYDKKHRRNLGKKYQSLKNKCDPKKRPHHWQRCFLGDCNGGPRWRTEPWGQCSADCGLGKQRRSVPCTDGKSGKRINRRFCDANYRPQRRRKCFLRSCQPMYGTL